MLSSTQAQESQQGPKKVLAEIHRRLKTNAARAANAGNEGLHLDMDELCATKVAAQDVRVR
jgi:hypothetical protein